MIMFVYYIPMFICYIISAYTLALITKNDFRDLSDIFYREVITNKERVVDDSIEIFIRYSSMIKQVEIQNRSLQTTCRMGGYKTMKNVIAKKDIKELEQELKTMVRIFSIMYRIYFKEKFIYKDDYKVYNKIQRRGLKYFKRLMKDEYDQ